MSRSSSKENWRIKRLQQLRPEVPSVGSISCSERSSPNETKEPQRTTPRLPAHEVDLGRFSPWGYIIASLSVQYSQRNQDARPGTCMH